MSDALSRRVGAVTTVTKQISEADAALFALLVGELPALSEELPPSAHQPRQIVPMAFVSALLATAAARHSFRPGMARLLGAQIRFGESVYTDDTLTTTAEVTGYDSASHSVRILARCTSQDGQRVAEGEFVLRED